MSPDSHIFFFFFFFFFFFDESSRLDQSWYWATRETFLPSQSCVTLTQYFDPMGSFSRETERLTTLHCICYTFPQFQRCYDIMTSFPALPVGSDVMTSKHAITFGVLL